ncbi:hypothetical protein ACWCQZ_35625 [Streptomyces sp. NPDC002285]
MTVFDATGAELATWTRGHRGIENLLHHVRDQPHLPRNLAITVLCQDGRTNIVAAVRPCQRRLQALGLT